LRNIFVFLFEKSIFILSISLLVPFLWIIEPFWRIRIRHVDEDRIGHLSMEMECYGRHIQLNPIPPRTTHIFIAHKPANRQLLEMWKRHFLIIESYLLSRASQVFLPLLKNTRFFLSEGATFQNSRISLSLGKPVLTFTEEEEKRGKNHLAKMGIGPNDWFVTFHARDSAFLDGHTSGVETELTRNYRNCSIESYIPAMKWITEQGGFAIRVGSLSNQPLPALGPKIIDYTKDHRNDFMDIYLAAKSKFFMGNTSGLTVLSVIFGVPSAMAHCIPVAGAELGYGMIFIPKGLRRRKDNKILSAPEIHNLGLFDYLIRSNIHMPISNTTAFYDDLGLELIENTPEDVLDLCKDMMDWVKENPPPNPILSAILQSKYRRFMNYPFVSLIGPRFAVKHKEFISPQQN